MSEVLPVVAADSGAFVAPSGGDGLSPAPAKPDKQKKKVRSAWISFISRILAQLIGAAAAVVLGVIVLNRYPPAALTGGKAGTAPVPSVQLPASLERVPGRLHIAVLPFENYSGDPRRDYLGDVLTEGVVSELSQFPELRVVSRTSSMHYRGSRKPVPEIGRELAVDLIVEGSFVLDGARLRVSAQLIDAKRDEHVWARGYQRAAQDALALQEELSAAIAKDVESRLKETPQWQAALPESRKGAPATGMNSQR